MKGKFDDWMFGCDVCQDVCPGIDFQNHIMNPFSNNSDILNFSKSDWEEITVDVFQKYLKFCCRNELNMKAYFVISIS